jgi:hypothetical protein
VTVEDIQAISLEVENVEFDSCVIKEWGPIIEALSKKQLTGLVFKQCTDHNFNSG